MAGMARCQIFSARGLPEDVGMAGDVPSPVVLLAPMPVASPCVNLCRLDRQSGYCDGCGRTMAEISNWLSGTAEWRQAVMAALPGRRIQAQRRP